MSFQTTEPLTDAGDDAPSSSSIHFVQGLLNKACFKDAHLAGPAGIERWGAERNVCLADAGERQVLSYSHCQW